MPQLLRAISFDALENDLVDQLLLSVGLLRAAAERGETGRET